MTLVIISQTCNTINVKTLVWLNLNYSSTSAHEKGLRLGSNLDDLSQEILETTLLLNKETLA